MTSRLGIGIGSHCIHAVLADEDGRQPSVADVPFDSLQELADALREVLGHFPGVRLICVGIGTAHSQTRRLPELPPADMEELRRLVQENPTAYFVDRPGGLAVLDVDFGRLPRWAIAADAVVVDALADAVKDRGSLQVLLTTTPVALARLTGDGAIAWTESGGSFVVEATDGLVTALDRRGAASTAALARAERLAEESGLESLELLDAIAAAVMPDDSPLTRPLRDLRPAKLAFLRRRGVRPAFVTGVGLALFVAAPLRTHFAVVGLRSEIRSYTPALWSRADSIRAHAARLDSILDWAADLEDRPPDALLSLQALSRALPTNTAVERLALDEQALSVTLVSTELNATLGSLYEVFGRGQVTLIGPVETMAGSPVGYQRTVARIARTAVRVAAPAEENRQ